MDQPPDPGRRAAGRLPEKEQAQMGGLSARVIESLENEVNKPC